jgi:hypothetical protein
MAVYTLISCKRQLSCHGAVSAYVWSAKYDDWRGIIHGIYRGRELVLLFSLFPLDQWGKLVRYYMTFGTCGLCKGGAVRCENYWGDSEILDSYCW